MIAQLHKAFVWLATWPVVALLVVGFLLCQMGFAWRHKALGPTHEVPDARLWYTPDDVRTFFDQIGDCGRQLYAFTQVTLDLANPLLYGTLFAVLIVRLFGSRYPGLVPLPVAAADLLENATT